MEIEFDPAKDAANRRKHGASFALARIILSNLVRDELDDREDYGEERIRAFGFVGTVLFACIYTMRGTIYRIISVRRATLREQEACLSSD